MSVKPHSPQVITMANREMVPITCTGNVKLQTTVGQHRYDVNIRNVYCAPKLTTNLLSVSQLIKKGNGVNFGKNVC